MEWIPPDLYFLVPTALTPNQLSRLQQTEQTTTASGATTNDNETPLDSGKDQAIIYKTQYMDPGGESAIFIKKNRQPTPQKYVTPLYNGPVMEYVDYFFTQTALTSKQKEKRDESSIHVSRRGTEYIRILSPCVIDALRCLVAHTPDQNLSSDSIIIHAPYAVLIFNEEKLDEYCKRLEADPPKPGQVCANRLALQHIRTVQEFVMQKVGHEVQEERRRHARGYATFDMLWLLLQPGIDVYLDNERTGEHEPFVLHGVRTVMMDGAVESYNLSYWNMDADSLWIGPVLRHEVVTRFGGEKKIPSLEVFPCDYISFNDGVTKQDAEAIRNHFINRGKQWYRLRDRPSFCQDFDGWKTTWPRRAVSILCLLTITP